MHFIRIGRISRRGAIAAMSEAMNPPACYLKRNNLSSNERVTWRRVNID